jgi:hypothetical protein
MSNATYAAPHNYGGPTSYPSYREAPGDAAPPGAARHSAATGDRPHRPAWLDAILEQDQNSRICLSDAVASAVFRHVAKNLDARFAREEPQLLIVTGPFGCGKTVSIRETLRRIGCEINELHASELESHLSNVPAERIRARYVDSSEKQIKDGVPRVLLIEDIHMAFGIDATTTRTQNIDLAIAALMGIIDNPFKVGNATTRRIPIIATANDLSKVYGALIRPGRTRVVAMELSDADRRRITMHMLYGVLTPEQIDDLLVARPTWSIATFRQLKAELLNREFDLRYEGMTATQILLRAMRSRDAADDHAAKAAVTPKDLDRANAVLDGESLAKRDFAEDPSPK